MATRSEPFFDLPGHFSYSRSTNLPEIKFHVEKCCSLPWEVWGLKTRPCLSSQSQLTNLQCMQKPYERKFWFEIHFQLLRFIFRRKVWLKVSRVCGVGVGGVGMHVCEGIPTIPEERKKVFWQRSFSFGS